jgi:hypothetical protein
MDGIGDHHLGEISQTQNYKYNVFSHMQNLDFF